MPDDKTRWTAEEKAVFTIRIPQSLIDRINACTFTAERTRSDLVRSWILEGVEDIEVTAKLRAK